MAQKAKSVYVCRDCGYQSPKWSGKCPECGAWNTMDEEIIAPAVGASKAKAAVFQKLSASPVNEISIENEHRYISGIKELDRVLGGGIVKGSVVLLSGEPGIGKSTILLQMCGKIANELNILYVSGEESSRQIKLRAQRLGVNNPKLFVMSENSAEDICEYVRSAKPDLVMIDSIQTMNITELNTSSGSISQVRECTNLFLRTAKFLDIPFFIVGHVNKDGGIAGPKVMEHIVDAVLYFEGDRNYSYRILRATKNRFGSTNEIGVFEMRDSGLCEVTNPSEMLLSGRMKDVSGTCVACTVEGTRPILAEIQGLVCVTGFGTPRRMATGFDYNRMNLILAVLEKRLGFVFANLDVYLNVVGGLRLDEPATDLSVAMALVSGLKDMPISERCAVFGEVGLSGELRAVPHAAERIKEAQRLGFTKCVFPKSCLKQFDPSGIDIELMPVSSLKGAIAAVFC